MLAKNLFIFYFFILLHTKGLFSKTLFGINTSRLEKHYTEILFNDNLSNTDRILLANRMSAALIHLNAEKDFGELEKNCKVMDQSQNGSLLLINVTKEAFEFAAKNANERNIVTLGTLCLLWQFSLNLEAKTMLKMNKPLTNTNMHKSNMIDCNLLDQMSETSKQNAKKNVPPNWFGDFRDYLSSIHLYTLNALVNGEEGRQVDSNNKMPAWFADGQQMKGETKISHLLRAMNVRGQMEKLKETKRRIMLTLLSQEDLTRLEMLNPIRMAAGR
uniref:Uncharacterized protein n=1 Tax=Globodera rostochiensis TaxID=31243 RepID=A0A914IBU3_GLORO